MGVFLSHPNHRSKPYLISTLAGWRDQESTRHTWVCPVLTLSWVRYGFRSYHMREHQRSNLSSWEWCQMALCVFIQCQGCSIAKEWMASLATLCNSAPKPLGLQGKWTHHRLFFHKIHLADECVITKFRWLASVGVSLLEIELPVARCEPTTFWTWGEHLTTELPGLPYFLKSFTIEKTLKTPKNNWIIHFSADLCRPQLWVI